jgi:thiol-disulfide isomerase/thioredoxin
VRADTPWNTWLGWLSPVSKRPRVFLKDLFLEGASWSGHERDHLFMNAAGQQFYDVATLAGIDNIGDGRSGVVLDIDRDGWSDIAAVNSNAPQLVIYRNRIGERMRRNVVAVVLHGGNITDQPSKELSNRDGVGAIVTVTTNGMELRRELRAGEGYAAQNMGRLYIGVGDAEVVDAVRVDWPSGRTQAIESVESGRWIHAYELASASSDPSGFEVGGLVAEGASQFEERDVPSQDQGRLEIGGYSDGAALRLYVGFATWCASCAAEVPRLLRLQSEFGHSQLRVVGVAVDPEDTESKLADWVAKHYIESSFLISDSAADRESYLAAVKQVLGRDGLPTSILTDGNGRILNVQWGVPSVSDLRRYLARPVREGG